MKPLPMVKKSSKTQWYSLLAITIVNFLTIPSFAYYSTLDTGSLLDRDSHKVTAETQFVTSDNEGVNLVGRYDIGLSHDSNLRAILGFGTTDFQIGALYKWVPIPDVDNQPAIGLLGGVQYASFSGKDDLSLRFHPLISKSFEVDFGDLTPYASLPFGIRSMDGKNDVPVQFALGAELKTLDFHNLRFMAEIGFNVRNAFSYFSLAANLTFDDESGFKIISTD